MVQLERQLVGGSVEVQLQNGGVRRAAGLGGDRGVVQQIDDRVILLLLVAGL